jgi:Flp pilus assembly protein TadG
MFFMALLGVLVILVIAASGCVSQDSGESAATSDANTTVSSQNNSGSQPLRWDDRNTTNMTDAERQQMFESMMQAASAACQNKTEGDSCTMQNQRGEMSGTCKTQEDKLMCMGAGPSGRRGPPPNETNGG